MKKTTIGLAIFLILILWSCNDSAKVPIPDVSGIDLTTRFVRYEQLLARADTLNSEAAYNEIARAYPAFTELYFGRLVPLYRPGMPADSLIVEFQNYITDPGIRHLLDTVAIVHNDFDTRMRPAIEQAFKNTKYYFPRWKEPDVYTLISDFGYQHFLFEDENRNTGLGIGLDLYLGRDFPYHRIAPGNPSFSQYITRTFDKDHMVKRAMESIYDELEGPLSGPRMLDQMMDNGKRLYVLSHILPTTPDSILLEFTAEQTDWVMNNEEQMWAFFFKEKLFYETDMLKINKYINTSPESPGMPAEAPGMTGNYIGWQIIKSYMERFPSTTIQQLLTMTDAQKIMDDSKYKPKKKK